MQAGLSPKTAGSPDLEKLSYSLSIPEGRYLLCRPRGGMNDALCQIERCWRYAEHYARTLIVDSRNSFFVGKLNDVFQLPDHVTNVFFDPPWDVLAPFNDVECQPKDVAGVLDSYETLYSYDLKKFIHAVTGNPITFDFEAEHSERLLIHEQGGGGHRSFSFFERVKLGNSLAGRLQMLLKEANLWNTSYVAIHIRNTDYQTDFFPYFETIKDEIGEKDLLVCSDDASAIESTKAFFSGANVIQLSDIPPTGGLPLHNGKAFQDKQKRERFVEQAIVDLIALSLSERLYFTRVTAGVYSGFSLMAKYLNENKSVIKRLLDE